MVRDLAWLSKNVVSNFETYILLLDSSDPIFATLDEELRNLFGLQPGVETTGADIRLYLSSEMSDLSGSFRIEIKESSIDLIASESVGLLYALYQLHRDVIILGKAVPRVEVPEQSLRMINHWDSMDGSIERGYAGDSIFFEGNHFRKDSGIVKEYARLLASVGINALSINNVNVHAVETRLISEEFLEDLSYVSSIFQSYGIKTFLSVNFASPKILGGLPTADPLNRDVIDFWGQRIARLYDSVPGFGGFVVKADSEGEPGPFAYGRTHADGANMFGRLLSPYGGLCIWRCFVYNSKQDWRDRSIDRACAAYDHFLPYDGQFLDNVILQIKLGPLDFQVKEPVSPLFGALRQTNQMIEFQLTQEYTGQQKAFYYQVPVWKEALEFDTQYEDVKHSKVKELIKDTSVNRLNSGICAVGLVGMDDNWTGLKLMQINLFAYGRLAWNSNFSAEELAQQWAKLTFDLSKAKQDELVDMLCSSRETYQLYNAPFGVGFMCKPNHHYGPDVNGYEYDRWGTYHFADRNGVGVDRTMAGTGFVGQYSSKIQKMYGDLETCPEDLLLWFHHLPYDYRMKNGKTLIQNIYNNHFEGVERVKKYLATWESFRGLVSDDDFNNVEERLQEQLRVAIEWRDQINTYFYRFSGVKDDEHRTIYR